LRVVARGVPFSPVPPRSANRPFRLQRLARFGAMLRATACLLALSLAFGGYLAAAVPLHGAAAPAAHADGEDCGHHAMSAKHASAQDDCCRVACACALGHAIAEPASPACVGVPAAVAPPVPRGGDVRIARGEPPLRPPIA